MPKLAKLGMDLTHLTMISMIVAITILVVMIPLLRETSTEAEKTFTRAQCATSVRQQAIANTYFAEAFARDLDCPPEEIEVTVQSEDLTTKQAAFRAVGDAMLSCWDDFGRGQLNLFGAEGLYCNVCSYMEFDKKSPQKSFGGLNQFLANSRPPAQARTYMERLSGVETDQFKELFDDPSRFQIPQDSITNSLSTDKLYSVIFVYAKGKDTIGSLKDKMGGSLPVLGWGLGGSAVAGIGVGALIFFSGPVGWVGAGLIGAGVAGTGAGLSIWSYLSDTPPEWLAFVSFGEHEPAKLAQLGCGQTRSN